MVFSASCMKLLGDLSKCKVTGMEAAYLISMLS